LDLLGSLLPLVFASLSSAARARRADSIAVARLDLFVEYVGDGAAHREMLRFVAERTRHPTTARIERVDRVARPSKHAHGVMILLRCLLMAMAVIDERFVLFGEVDRLVESEAVDVFAHAVGVPGDVFDIAVATVGLASLARRGSQTEGLLTAISRRLLAASAGAGARPDTSTAGGAHV